MIDLNRVPLATEDIQVELLRFLQLHVPEIIITDDTWTVGSFKHNDITNQIIEQIAWWLFEGEEDEQLAKLKELNNPSSVCGHVFKPGETTYTCRECAADQTCCFCQPCFRKSEHINHKYKFHSSNGGGCCDCGDEEAWSQFPSCSIHTPDPDAMMDVSQQLSSDMQNRAEKMISALMDYIVSFLTVDRLNCSDLPQSLTVQNPPDNYITVVYNDEVHTFDFVIDVLQRAVSCPANVASDYATIIDREGRSVIRIGDLGDCNASKDVITSSRGQSVLTHQRHRTSLVTAVLHSAVVAHQEFSLTLLAWLSKIVKESDILRNIISSVLLSNGNDITTQKTYAAALMLADKNMWKMARAAYQQLLMTTLLLQSESKKAFGVEFAKIYFKLKMDFLNDDHDHSDSISSMSVQLFTVPTLARYLVAEEKLLSSVFEVITKCCCVTQQDRESPDNSSFALDKRSLKKHSQRIDYCFYDLKYILSNVPADWNEKLKEGFKEFFSSFLKFSSAMEGMDATVRQTGYHLEFEPEWETGVTLQLRLVNIIALVLQWCSSSRDFLVECVELTIQLLESVWTKENSSKIKLSFNNMEYDCVDYDVTTQPVSVHYPLTRFLAGLLTHCGRLNVPLSTPLLTRWILDASDRSFRALALCAKVTAGAWRRNGLGLANQVFYARHSRCRQESFDRDIQMLQACAALIDPNQFCLILKQKMSLIDPSDFAEYRTSLNEEFLSIIMYVCAERYGEGIGVVGYEERARREIIHTLASGPKPHSKIQKSMGNEITDNPAWEEILPQVAELKPATNFRSGAKYELKAEYLNQVSSSFHHYPTASDESNAHTETITRKKASGLSLVSIPCLAPRFTEPFSAAINVLLCPVLLLHIKELLTKYVPNSTQPYQWSDKLFEKILYLIGLGIIEERERLNDDPQSSFNFCKQIETSGAMEILRGYADKSNLTVTHQENVSWVVAAVNEVNSKRMGTVEETPTEQSLATSASSQNLNEARERKEMAKKRRENLIKHMKDMQKKFLEKMTPELEGIQQPSTPAVPVVDESASELSICTEMPWQLSSVDTSQDSDVCILCQDETRTKVSMVMSAFVQLSPVLSKSHLPPEDAVKHFGSITNPAGVHMSTCSHVMHFDCWSQYFESVKEKNDRRPQRMRRFLNSFSTLKNEFLCPLCSRLSNCVIPVIPHKLIAEKRLLSSTANSTSLQQWLSSINDFVDPPEPMHQEVVIKLHLSPGASEDDPMVGCEPNLDVSNSCKLPPQPIEEVTLASQDEEENVYQPVFDVLAECITKNCLTGDCTDEMMVWLATAYTFQVTEVVARFQSTPLMAPPSVRVKQALSSIVRCGFLASKYCRGSEGMHEGQMKVLLGKSSQSLLNTNIFCTFVKSIFSCEFLREKIQSSSVSNDKHVLFLCALAQIVQIMLYIDVEEITAPGSTSSSNLIDLFNQVRSHAGFPQLQEIDEAKLESVIFDCFKPFLRTCALLLRHVTNVSPSDSLKRDDNFADLCRYLGVPTDIAAYFDVNGETGLDPLVQRWCSHTEVAEVVKTGSFPSFPALIRINELIGLDEDYSDVMAKHSEFLCPRFRVEDDSITPATCLVCGDMLCSQSYCCQQKLENEFMGACSYHSHSCSFGSGLFLRGRDCTLIFLNQTRGCYRPAPYLDQFGETDLGLRRGNPLKLDRNRLKELNLLWLTHSIPETIVRESEANHGLFNVDWVHL